jgi:hypothetical protein
MLWKSQGKKSNNQMPLTKNMPEESTTYQAAVNLAVSWLSLQQTL